MKHSLQVDNRTRPAKLHFFAFQPTVKLNWHLCNIMNNLMIFFLRHFFSGLKMEKYCNKYICMHKQQQLHSKFFFQRNFLWGTYLIYGTSKLHLIEFQPTVNWRHLSNIMINLMIFFVHHFFSGINEIKMLQKESHYLSNVMKNVSWILFLNVFIFKNRNPIWSFQASPNWLVMLESRYFTN